MASHDAVISYADLIDEQDKALFEGWMAEHSEDVVLEGECFWTKGHIVSFEDDTEEFVI